MAKHTIATVRAELATLGVVVAYSAEWEEYCVKFRGEGKGKGSMIPATHDKQGALQSCIDDGYAMAEHRANSAGK